MAKKLKMGMIGGDPGAFIGAVHRMAANLNGQIELVAELSAAMQENRKRWGW